MERRFPNTLFVALGLLTPVLGAARMEAVIQRVNALGDLGSVRELRPFLTL